MPDQEQNEQKTQPEEKRAAPADRAPLEDDAPAEKELEKIVDEDWKAQARQEKEKLDEKVKEKTRRERAGEGAGRETPPADFLHFVSGMATQTLMQLGEIENPLEGGDRKVDLAAARYSIDVLQMLAEKTKGNLTDEEDQYLRAALHDLRMRFVDAAGGPSSKTGSPPGRIHRADQAPTRPGKGAAG